MTQMVNLPKARTAAAITAATHDKYVFDAGLARVDRPTDKRLKVEAGFSRARRER
jgi:hypothetical protein